MTGLFDAECLLPCWINIGNCITVSVNVVAFVTLMGNTSSLIHNETADKMPFNY